MKLFKKKYTDYRSEAWKYESKGQYDLALASYAKAIELAPENHCIWDARGDFYRDRGDYNAAISDYSKALELIDPLFMHILAGDIERKKQEAAEKEAQRLKTAQDNKAKVAALLRSGDISGASGDYNKAIKDYNAAIEIESDNAEAKAKFDEATKRLAEETAKQKAAEEETKRNAAEEEARQKAVEEEARRNAAEEEARQKAVEEEAKRNAAEEEARQKAAEALRNHKCPQCGADLPSGNKFCIQCGAKIEEAPPPAAPAPAAPASTDAPPPLPGAARPDMRYHVALGGKQAGPFDWPALEAKTAAGEITRETQVWKKGMAAWAPAGSVAELAPLFENAPPPLPPG
jgi:hypothetical protein